MLGAATWWSGFGNGGGDFILLQGKGCVMSLQTVGHQFVELCNQAKNFDVMRTMYDPEIVSVEGDGKETSGQEKVIGKSKQWAEDNEIHGEKARGPYFNGGNQFAVYYTWDLTRKGSGKRETIEEVGLYTVGANEKIMREQFFYEGVH
jgi:hypothetical protein